MFKLVLVAFAIWLELMLVVSYQPYPHGEIFAVQYRNQERYAAWNNSIFHPSPTTKAAFQEEMRLMHKHEDWKTYVALGFLGVLNVVGIYYFLNYDQKKTTANQQVGG